MRHPDIFLTTLLDDSGGPIRELGQITGVLKIAGEPNPSRNLEGEADQRFIDCIAQLPRQPPLRIAGTKKSMIPTLVGQWLVTRKGDRRVEIASQGKITSHS